LCTPPTCTTPTLAYRRGAWLGAKTTHELTCLL
jgi:hypothetical protein